MHATLRDANPPLTRSVEDYLKVIYHLSNQGGFAATSDIAAMLEVAPPSVSGMVKRLSEAGLIEHVPYRGVQLTAQGRRAALRMIRRHRILEAYLTQHLGYDWDGVQSEAERMEHAVSDDLIERMAGALGNPRYDPHGEPIPTAAGDIGKWSWCACRKRPGGRCWNSGRWRRRTRGGCASSRSRDWCPVRASW